MGQRSMIDFCIVSTLFSSVVDVSVKRRAELSTNHHLVICIQKDLNHPRTRKQFRAWRAYRIKWESIAKKKGATFLQAKLPPCLENFLTILKTMCLSTEDNTNLFKTAVITSAAVIWGCKCVGGQINSEKRTAWWNQEVKEAIHAKKLHLELGEQTSHLNSLIAVLHSM